MELFTGILPLFPFCPQLLVQLAVVLQEVTLPLLWWCQTVSFPPPLHRNNVNSYQIKKIHYFGLKKIRKEQILDKFRPSNTFCKWSALMIKACSSSLILHSSFSISSFRSCISLWSCSLESKSSLHLSVFSLRWFVNCSTWWQYGKIIILYYTGRVH